MHFEINKNKKISLRKKSLALAEEMPDTLKFHYLMCILEHIL